MRGKNWRRMMSLLLAAAMLITSFPMQAFAADTTPKVEIVSFNRGPQADLRASELLEARVTGYSGNVQELTYEWKNELGTYLYVYNSHNMYGIDDTDGEVEISNKNGLFSTNTFSGIGFAWAAVYGAYRSAASALAGTITVIVRDSDGNELCRDTHTGTVTEVGTWPNKRYEYSGFLPNDLGADIGSATIGLFEGGSKEITDLFGEAAITHITCDEAIVSEAEVPDESEQYITIGIDSEGNTILTALKPTEEAGDAKITFSIKKNNCKFHYYSDTETSTTTVHVFRKPTTSTTTTTLTLTSNLDSRCRYFIDGKEGVRQSNGTILFDGLKPDTRYTVEVRAEYQAEGATQYVYAYVYDTTKPVRSATVSVYLDDDEKDITAIDEDVQGLYIRVGDNGDYQQLEKDENSLGTYSKTNLQNGTYKLYFRKGKSYSEVDNVLISIQNTAETIGLYYYSVSYDTDGGEFKMGEAPDTQIYREGTAVNAITAVPEKTGFNFVGWEVNEGETIQPGSKITGSIDRKTTLTALWQDAVNVTINVTIDHMAGDDLEAGYDINNTKEDVYLSLVARTLGTRGTYLETGHTLTLNSTSFSKHNYFKTFTDGEKVQYTGNENGTAEWRDVILTEYLADGATFTGLSGSKEYYVATPAKSGYDVTSVTSTQDSNGDWTITVNLKYNPNDFDLFYSVHMADDVPKELYPDAVIVKIAYWDKGGKTWKVITQQEGNLPGERVEIDPDDGRGYILESGKRETPFYPVWQHDTDGEAYGYRTVITGFVYDNNTIKESDNQTVNGLIVSYSDGNYTGTMGPVTDGRQYGSTNNLYGAYYNGSGQSGTLTTEISVEKYDVTFDAEGGKIGTEDQVTVKDQYYVPAFAPYKPTRADYDFKGWYTDSECTIPATEGALLYSDVTLYAKWVQKIYVQGTVTIEDFYMQGGEKVSVHEIDRATEAVVELQTLVGGHYSTVATEKVTFIPDRAQSTGKRTADYSFGPMTNDGTDYRILVRLLNYTALYDNERDDNSEYSAEEYIADFGGDNIADVDVLLDFVPDSYDQLIIVDASKIGEGYRPTEVVAKVLYRDLGTDSEYAVISQHTVDPFGKKLIIREGIGTGNGTGRGTESVWKYHFNGTLYQYQVEVFKLYGSDTDVYKGEEKEYDREDSTYPYTITYGEPAIWNISGSSASGPLTATLVPKEYDVIFDMNAGTDTISGMEAYYNGSAYTTDHTWSYDTPIPADAKPSREGYTFGGWYTNSACTGDQVTEIDASVHGDTTLYAKWTPRTDLLLKVKHIDTNTKKVLSEITYNNQEFGTTVNVHGTINDGEPIIKTGGEFAEYRYVSADPEELTIGTGENLITIEYTKDHYYYTVHYRDQDAAADAPDIADPLIGNAAFGATVTGYIKSIAGYNLVGGQASSFKIDEDNKVVTVYYTKKTDLGMTVEHREILSGGTAGEKLHVDTVLSGLTFGSLINLEILEVKIPGFKPYEDNKASTTLTSESQVETLYYERLSYEYTVEYYFDGVKGLTETKAAVPFGTVIEETFDFEKVNGSTKYIYDHTENNPLTIKADPLQNVIKVYYLSDTDDNDVPDVYQATVTYQIVNGTWDGTDANPKTYTFVLKEFKDGKWQSKAQTLGDTLPLKMYGNDGYTENPGSWNKEITKGTPVTRNAVYVFTFSTRDSHVIVANVINGSVTVNGVNNGTHYENTVVDDNSEVTTMKFAAVADTGYALDYVSVDGTTVYTTAQLKAWNEQISFDHKKDHTITVKYDIDSNNDQIPDKYQKPVTFVINNGTWKDNTTNPIPEYVTLYDENGNWSASGSGTLLFSDIPTGMLPAEGYNASTGKWDTTKIQTATGNITLTGTAPETYTYGFDKIKITVVIGVENGSSNPAASTTEHDYDSTKTTNIVFTPKEGYTLDYVVVDGNRVDTRTYAGGAYTYQHDYKNDFTIFVKFDKDSNRDNIPDKYQAVVKFEVENGTWKDPSKAVDKWVTLYEKTAAGEWTKKPAQTVGTLPEAIHHYGFNETGTWTPDVTADTVVAAPDPVPEIGPTVYTYKHSFTKKVYDITVIVENGSADPAESPIKVEHGAGTTIKFTATDGYALDTVTVTHEDHTHYGVLDKDGNYVFENVTSDRTIKVVYATDGNNDKIPDKYQKTVTYSIVNGKWANGTTAPIEELFTLYEKQDGEWQPTGVTLKGRIPTGMQPAEGYKATGKWDEPKPTADHVVVGGEAYVYRYSDLQEFTVDVTVKNGTAKAGETDVTGKAVIVEYGDDLLLTFKAEAGYALESVTVDGAVTVFNGTSSYSFSDIEENHSIVVVYEMDRNGDEVPDMHQGRVIYQIVGGTWNGTDSAPKNQYFDIEEYDTTDGTWKTVNPVPTLGTTVPDTTTDAGARPDKNHVKDGAAWQGTAPTAETTVAKGTTTYTYEFPVKMVNLTFDAKGGSWNTAIDGFNMIAVGSVTNAKATKQLAAGTDISAVANPAKTGYTFMGWYDNAEYEGNIYTFGKMPNTDLTLYARWEANPHIITYVDGVDGEEVFADKVIPAVYGENTPEFGADPVRPGYVFKRWSPDVKATVDGDQTYTAQWNAVYTLTFVANGGHWGMSVDGYDMTSSGTESGTEYIKAAKAGIENGTVITAISRAPHRLGYDFAGWYTIAADGEGTKYWADATAVHTLTGDLTLYAHWTARTDNTLTVRFEDKHTKEIIKVPYTKTGVATGTTYTDKGIYENPEFGAVIDGYTFSDEPDNDVIIVAGSNNITLKYVKNSYSYTVNYLEQGTNKVLHPAKTVDKDLTYGTEKPELAETINGYSLVAGNEGYNLSGKLDEISYNDGNLTFAVKGDGVINFYYAKRADLSLTVNYYLKDTTDKVADPATFSNKTFGEVVTAESVKQIIPGYVYDSASAESVTIGTNPELNVLNLYYTKANINYKVEYYFDDGTGYKAAPDEVDTITGAKYGDIINDYQEPSKPLTGYALDYTQNLPLTIGTIATDNIIKVYYSKDTIGGPDNIPDKYQRVVTYRIIGGSWTAEAADTADKISVLTVAEKVDGEWKPIRATLGDTIPDISATTPDINHVNEGKGWETVPTPDTVVGNAEPIFIYSFPAKNVIVTFDANGGSWATEVGNGYNMETAGEKMVKAAKALDAGSKVTEITAPTITNGDFAGWYTDSACTTTYTFPGTMPATDLTLYAKWNATITYEDGVEGETLFEQVTTGVAFGSATPAFEGTPTRGNHRFTGWSPAVKPTVDGNQTYEAQWVPTYTLTFNANGGSWSGEVGTYVMSDGNTNASKSGIAEDDTVYLIGTNPERTGYVFDGWYTEPGPECTTEYIFPGTMPDEDLTLYAKWTQVYTLTFNANDGSWAAEVGGYAMGTANETAAKTGLRAGDAISAIGVIPQKVGHAFVGWYTEPGCTTPYTFPGTMPSDDLTLYAKWSANAYTIIYTDGVDGVEVFADQVTNVEYGKNTPDFEGTPARTGYTFTNWSPAVETTVTHSMTYTAQWSPIEYNLTFDANGGSWTAGVDGYTMGTDNVSATIKKTMGQTVNSIGTSPTNSDNIFGGWYTEPECTTPYVFPGTMQAADLTLYAKWISKDTTFTVTWLNEDGSIVLETDNGVPAGTTPTYDGAAPVKAPDVNYTYTFAGWTPEVVPVTCNAEYRATFTPQARNFTITFEENGGTEVTDITAAYGQVISKPSDPTRTPDIFVGWYEDPGFAGDPYVFSTMPGKDMTLYAKWVAAGTTYTVTWMNYDGTELEVDTGLAVGTMPEYNGSTPVRAEDAAYVYTFAGWIPTKLPVTRDAVYTATFTETPKVYTMFFDENGGEPVADIVKPYGTAITEPVTTKGTDIFVGWYEDPGFAGEPYVFSTMPAEDKYLYARWEPAGTTYTVTWLNHDSTQLEVDTDVAIGTMPEYNGETPVKAADDVNTYTFAGWTPDVVKVTKNAIYTAKFTATPIGGGGGTTPPPPEPEPVIPMDVVSLVVHKKVINTGDADLSPEGFEFVLEEVGTGKKTVKNTGEEGFAFFTLTYFEEDAGVYNYRIYETNTGAANIIYDDTVYDVTVDVEIKYGWPVATVYINGMQTETSFVMLDAVNVETSGIGAVTVPVMIEKIVDNIDGANAGPEEFKVVCENTTTGEKTFHSFDEDGEDILNFSFGLEDADKTHTYRIYELNEGRKDVEYDDAVYELKVTVSFDGTYALKADVLFNGEEDHTYIATFENIVSGADVIEEEPDDSDLYGEDENEEDVYSGTEETEVPKTDDELMTKLWLYMMMMQASLAGMLFIGIRRKTYR